MIEKTNIEIFKKFLKIDNIFQSFPSIEHLKSFVRGKYWGKVDIFINGKYICSVKCINNKKFKRHYLYK